VEVVQLVDALPSAGRVLRAGTDQAQQCQEVAEADLAIGTSSTEVVGKVTRATGYAAGAWADQAQQCKEVTEADLTISAPTRRECAEVIGDIAGAGGHITEWIAGEFALGIVL